MGKVSVPVSSDEHHFDVAILQPGYLPWLGYFDLVAMADVFVLYDDVQFDKGGWRNRNRVLSGGEPLWLTVPIVQRFPQLITEVRIASKDWQAVHLRSIVQNYGKAPFFEEVFPHLEAYLSGRRYELLLDLCTEGHKLFTRLLGLATKTCLSSELGVDKAGRTERLVAICQKFQATRYISPDAAKAYMVPDLWSKAGIELAYQQYPHPKYPQFSGEFVSHLSVVDAMMFAGPEKVRTWLGISHPKRRQASHAGL